MDGRWDYENEIVKPKKKRVSTTAEVGSSSTRFLSDDAEAYFDDLFGKIFANNQVRED